MFRAFQKETHREITPRRSHLLPFCDLQEKQNKYKSAYQQRLKFRVHDHLILGAPVPHFIPYTLSFQFSSQFGIFSTLFLESLPCA